MSRPHAVTLKARNNDRRRRQAWRYALKPIPGIFDWYKDNVAAGTLLVAAFLVLKGYALAKGDLATALGILQYAGLTSVVIAGLLSSLPILAAALLATTVYRETRAFRSWVWRKVPPKVRQQTRAFFRRQGERGNGTRSVTVGQRLALTVTGLSAFVLAALFTPWPFMAAAIGIGLVTGTWPGLVQRRPPGRRVPASSPAAIARSLRAMAVGGFRAGITVIAVYGVTAMLATVWVPHTIVTFARSPVQGKPARPLVGYVLADDPDGWITILTSGEHGIIRYRDSLVKSLTLCERFPRGGWSDIVDARTPWEVITTPSRLEPALLRGIMRALHPSANQKCPPGV
jgi:hypothetical protein